MKVEINPKQKIVIVLESQEYALTKPTLGMQDEFESKVEAAKESGKGGVRVMIEFVTACGLPDTVVRKLDQDELQAIMNALTPAKKN